MSETQGLEPTEVPGGSSTGEPQLSEFAQGILNQIPELERPIVAKYINDWDAGVSKRFQEVHSEYEAWKPFKEQGVDPEELNQLIALGQALNANPQETLNAIAEAYGIQFAPPATEQGTPTEPPKPTEVTPSPLGDLPEPVVQKLAMVDTMAEILLAQQRDAEARAADQELEKILSSAREKHGDFDERYVLTLIANGLEPDAAVSEFKALQDRLAQAAAAPSNNSPVVLGSQGGNGLPDSSVDVTKLDSKATRELVTQMLEAANKSA